MTRILWTDDYLVFEKPTHTISLAIMRNCTDASAAVKSYNRENKKGPRATHGVRISTFEGTLTNLLLKKDAITLRWAVAEDTENAKLAREIAKELGVKLPPKRKTAKS